MKKKLLTALLVSVCGLTCSVAAACANSGDSGNQEHEHSYQSGWSYDAENHFHSCTGEDCTATEASAVHTWGEGVEKTPATCTADGTETLTCTVCGYSKENTVPMLNHDWQLKETVAATCAADGVLKYECGNAGCTEKKEEKGAEQLSHDWKLKETVAATCTTDGVLKYECGNAGCTEKKEDKGADKLNHDWGSWDVTDAATPETEGEERRSCSRCDAYETRPVACLNTGYKIIVLTSGNVPLRGAEVYLDDNLSAQTDENGIAKFADDLERGQYSVTVDADGYALLGDVTTADEYVITVKLIKKPNGTGSSANPLKFDMSGIGSMDYFISVNWTEDTEMADRITPKELVAVIINNGSSAMEFVIDFKDKLAVAGHDNIPLHSMGIFGSLSPVDDNYTPVSVILEKGESYRFTLSANSFGLEDSQDKDNYPVNYALNVTANPAPVKGSTKSYMFDVALGDNEFTAETDWVYVKFDSAKIGNANALYKFTFDDSVAFQNFGSNIENKTPVYMNSGDTLEWEYYASCLYVNAPSKTFKFNIEEVIPEGTKGNPIAIELNETYTAELDNTDSGRIKYYKYTNASDSAVQLTFVPGATYGASVAVAVYSSNSSSAVVTSITGQKACFTVPAGETFVLAVAHEYNKGNVEFFVRAYDKEQDVTGDTYDTPVILTESTELTATFFNIRKYYKIITSVPGFYTVNVDLNGSETSSYHLANTYAPAKGKSWNDKDVIMYADHTLYREEKEIWIVLITTKDGGADELPFKITYEFEPLTPVEHTVTVTGDCNLNGLTVELKSDGETVATQTTDAHGVATFSVAPNEYDVVVSGFAAEYSYNAVTTPFNLDGCSVEVLLSQSTNYKFTVKTADGAPASGVTVKVDVNGTVISGVTDADGVFTTEKIVPGVYGITLEGFDTTSYFFLGATTTADNFDVELELSGFFALVHENNSDLVTITEGKGTIANKATTTSNCCYIFTAKTTGTYTINVSKKMASYSGIAKVYYGDTVNEDMVLSNVNKLQDFNTEKNIITDTVDAVTRPAKYGFASITVELKEGESLIMALLTGSTTASATINVEIAKVS